MFFNYVFIIIIILLKILHQLKPCLNKCHEIEDIEIMEIFGLRVQFF